MAKRAIDRALYAVPFVALLVMLGQFAIAPAEDAFILFRYAENLAAGHGIVYNVGADPVEGATSFLWVAVLTAARLVGFSIPMAAQVIGFASAVAVVCLLLHKHRTAEGIALALVFALSPVTIQYLSGFEAPTYTLLIVLWLAAHERGQYTAAALVSLAMGMIRPEGAALAALLWAADYRNARKWLPDVALYFVAIGAAYFVARWAYFGQLLPNTFYVKSAGATLHFGGADNYWPFYAVAALALWNARRSPAAWILFAFPLAYLTIEQWQNVGWRFQYPVLAGLLYLNRPHKSTTYALAAVSIALMFVSYQGKGAPEDERAEIGKRLSKWRFDGARPWMVSSEAGWLPYYSGWNAIDPVGLNDEYIARHGITDEYLDRHRPSLIMFHVYSPVWRPDWSNGDAQWNRLTQRLYQYATARGYRLAAITNIPADCRWWYVAPDAPEELDAEIRGANYPYVKPWRP